MKKIIFVILHIIAVISLMFCAMFCADIASNILSFNNGAFDDIVYTVIYISVTLSLGLLYAKYVLHFRFEEIGVCKKPPQLKCIAVGFCLPLAVTAFYLIFTDGSITSDNARLYLHIIDALFPTGIAAGICEEFIFRGLIMRIFEKKWNRAAAIFIPSFLFAALHILNIRMNSVDILQVLIAGTAVGVMFSLITYQSGSIWSSAIVHALWNAVILGGVFIIESPADGLSVYYFYRYELHSSNILLTGGRFGIEAALPAVIGYCIVSAIAFILLMKQSDKKLSNNGFISIV